MASLFCSLLEQKAIQFLFAWTPEPDETSRPRLIFQSRKDSGDEPGRANSPNFSCGYFSFCLRRRGAPPVLLLWTWQHNGLSLL